MPKFSNSNFNFYNTRNKDKFCYNAIRLQRTQTESRYDCIKFFNVLSNDIRCRNSFIFKMTIKKCFLIKHFMIMRNTMLV